jgi:hypothetical protein
MWTYANHKGECEFSPEKAIATRKPYLNNCGSAACAVGHGPAAGVRLLSSEIESWSGYRNQKMYKIAWNDYCERAFGVDARCSDEEFEFLFQSSWVRIDNTPHGAAARIRYLLDNGAPDDVEQDYGKRDSIRLYAPYKKGSRSATRRKIDAAKLEHA